LIFPPWINKFYIMDLRPKNSFDQMDCRSGFTVFLMSWINPDEKMADKEFDDYLRDGPLAALDAIEQATGESRSQCAGLLLGRYVAGYHQRLSGGEGRSANQLRHLPDHHARFLPAR
jgi:poly(3-hydroxyalkanoate) synthetase